MGDWRPSPEARREMREVAGLGDLAETYAKSRNRVESSLANACIALAEEVARLRPDAETLEWMHQNDVYGVSGFTDGSGEPLSLRDSLRELRKDMDT